MWPNHRISSVLVGNENPSPSSSLPLETHSHSGGLKGLQQWAWISSWVSPTFRPNHELGPSSGDISPFPSSFELVSAMLPTCHGSDVRIHAGVSSKSRHMACKSLGESFSLNDRTNRWRLISSAILPRSILLSQAEV